MKISHVRQPKGSYLCGQACLAMILGLDLDAACKVMGHSRRTWTREFVVALGPLAGGSRLTVVPSRSVLHSVLPPFCLIRARWGVELCGHFAVLADGEVYDPLLRGPVSLEGWLIWLKRHDGRVTSYMPILEPAKVMGATG